MLTKIAQKNKEVTYINISPATWTWPIIETQGFQFLLQRAVLLDSRAVARQAGHDHRDCHTGTQAIEGLAATDVELLTRHARYGCLSLICRTAGGDALPFILLPMRIRRGWIAPPAMQLIYCRDIAEIRSMRRRDRPGCYPPRQDLGHARCQRTGAWSDRHLSEGARP